MSSGSSGTGSKAAFNLTGAGIGFALVSALGFSTLGIFATTLYSFGFSVPQTLGWRFSIASIFLWCILGIRKGLGWQGRSGKSGTPARPGKNISVLLLLALIGFTPQAGLYFLAVKMLAPGITSLLLYLYPAFVLLLSAVFLRRKPTGGQMAALVMSFLGCVITFFSPGIYPVGGLLLGVLVAIVYGTYLVCAEKVLESFDPLFSTTVIMTVAGIVYWLWLVTAGFAIKVPGSPFEWLLIVGIALVATALPATTLLLAMKRIGAGNTSLVSTIEPVITVLLSEFFLGEELAKNSIWGGLFIIGGTMMLRFFPTKQS